MEDLAKSELERNIKQEIRKELIYGSLSFDDYDIDAKIEKMITKITRDFLLDHSSLKSIKIDFAVAGFKYSINIKADISKFCINNIIIEGIYTI